jgi:hypothetical protein
MEKDRSDFAVMNRMIDHIRLLIAVDDEAIPVKKKLEAQAILKDFQGDAGRSARESGARTDQGLLRNPVPRPWR